MFRGKRLYAAILLWYVTSRALLYALGVRFVADYAWQHFHDVALLKDRLWESLLYTHAFTPFINLVVGVVLKVSETHSVAIYQVLFWLLGGGFVASLGYVLRSLRVPDAASLALTALFSITPGFIYFESFLHYEFIAASLLMVASALLHRAFVHPTVRAFFAFFFVCAIVAYVRTSFHLVWLVAVVACVALFVREHWKRVLLGAAVPVLLVFALYTKNLVMFGFFGTSSNLGANMAYTTTRQLKKPELEQWIAKGILHPIAAVNAFSPPSAYAAWIDVDARRGVPVLDQQLRSNGQPNFNHWSFVEVARIRLEDARTYMARRKWAFVKTFARGLVRYHKPTSRWHPHDPDGSPHRANRAILEPWENLYNGIHCIPFGPIGLYMLLVPMMLAAAAGALRSVWRSRFIGHIEDKVLLFLVGNAVYVPLLSCMAATSSELQRYRFLVEAFMWASAAAWVASLLRRRRNAACYQVSSGAVAPEASGASTSACRTARPFAQRGRAQRNVVLVALAGFTLIAAALAIFQISRHYAEIWDDALFFRRVSYNAIHHGVLAWNLRDGPAQVGSSQLYQGVSVLLLWLFPGHYNAASIAWGALCLVGCASLLWSSVEGGSRNAVLLFFLMQAPPVLLALQTGMETATSFAVFALFLVVLLRYEPGARRSSLLVVLHLAVYLVRPDAILLSMASAFGALWLEGHRRTALISTLAAGACLALVLAGLKGYYGTALPLSTYLKISPLSIYDADYLASARQAKIENLAQFALLCVPLVTAAWLRKDGVNRSLLAASLLFVSYHALATTEIMAYHARYYAPAMPFLFVAAVRGIEASEGKSQVRRIGVVCALVGVAVLAGSMLGLLENGRSYWPARVTVREYVSYLAGFPLAVWLTSLSARAWAAREGGEAGITRSSLVMLAVPAVLAITTIVNVIARVPAHPVIAADAVTERRALETDRSLRGASEILRCFPQPLQLTHSEIGAVGVAFRESYVYDFTGLANQAIAEGRFDFEAFCTRDRPEFVFKPHWTHVRLNRLLDDSPCLAGGYTAVNNRKTSSAPLFVRNDLLAQFRRCQRRRS